jgi:hypothetical protein
VDRHEYSADELTHDTCLRDALELSSIVGCVAPKAESIRP